MFGGEAMSLNELLEDTKSFNEPFWVLNERAKKKGLHFDICLGCNGEIFALYDKDMNCFKVAKSLSELHSYIDALDELGIEKIEDLLKPYVCDKFFSNKIEV